MTVSIWRYSHLTLAISSSIFLLIASLTGVILAFEPIDDKIQSYKIPNANTLSLAKVIENIDSQYKEVLTISKDKNDFVSITAILMTKRKLFT